MRKYIFVTAGVMATCLIVTNVIADSNNYSLGVEGFYDNYKEPDATVDSKAEYGSITGNYTHNWNEFFAVLDGRVSYGQDKYSSSDGSVSGVPQWEFELRPRTGFTFKTSSQSSLSPYIGLGARYYMDEFKGYTTTDADGNVYGGYDRRIFQLYLPVGATYAYTTFNGWSIVPNIEYDQLLWGQVSSRLGTLGGGQTNTLNDQYSGWGVRGRVMFGREQNGWSWQVGPFVRYWDIQASDFSSAGTQNGQPLYGEEPANTRLQVGLALRALW